MWLWGMLSIIIVLIIFFGTINFTPENISTDLWVKVKLHINKDVCAGWCRVIPGKEVKYYKLDGSSIDHKNNTVSIIEKCEDSSSNHPIPQDKSL